MKAKTVKEVLVATKWILENVGWCQHNYARDAAGKGLGYMGITCPQNAASFCLSGAFEVVEVESKEVYVDTKLLLNKVAEQNYVIFNDSCQNKRQVLEMLDRAIARVS